jgi:hypothetical protein
MYPDGAVAIQPAPGILDAGEAWDAACDMYVVIMKDRNVSLPERISLEGMPEIEIPTETW